MIYVGDPYSVTCPTCGAPPDKHCRNTKQPHLKSSVVHSDRCYDANFYASLRAEIHA